MWKTVLLITVFGLQQLIEASVLKSFKDNPNELSRGEEKSKDEFIRNKLKNSDPRSFQSLPFLFFDGKAEGDYIKHFGTLFKMPIK